jgi:hypothetical protein
MQQSINDFFTGKSVEKRRHNETDSTTENKDLGSTLTFEPTCHIGQVTGKFYLSESENYFSEVLLVSNMHDQLNLLPELVHFMFGVTTVVSR